MWVYSPFMVLLSICNPTLYAAALAAGIPLMFWLDLK
jgi:hypothetical protein